MFARRIERLSSSLIREILHHSQDPAVISFAGGLPAASQMPPLDLAVPPAGISQYGSTEGEPALREVIAAQLSAAGRPCMPEQVLITSGSQQGIDLVAKLFIDDDTPVLLESPTYLAALQSFRLFGARFLGIRNTADAGELARLAAQKPAFAYLIPTFQNPTGYVYGPAERQAVAEVLDRFRIPLVEDEPYRALSFTDTEHPPVSGMLERAPWIYLGTFSKTAVPGLRLGFLACSPELYPYFVRLKQAADLHSNRVGQWWLSRYLSSDDYPRRLAGLRDYYRGQRDLMQAALKKHFGDIATWETPQGGLFFWLKLAQRLDTRTLLPEAISRKVLFMPGEPFYPDAPDAAGTLRLNFSHASAEQIERGLATLAGVVRGAVAPARPGIPRRA